MTDTNKSRLAYWFVILVLLVYIASLVEKLEKARYDEGYLRGSNRYCRNVFSGLDLRDSER